MLCLTLFDSTFLKFVEPLLLDAYIKTYSRSSEQQIEASQNLVIGRDLYIVSFNAGSSGAIKYGSHAGSFNMRNKVFLLK